MSNSLNKIYLLGRLGKDPEVRSTQSGRTVTTLSLATSETHGKGQDKKENTAWHKIICWDKLGEIAGSYLKKGSQVHVEGKITYRDYMDRDNQKRFVTEIIALSFIFLGKVGSSTTTTPDENQTADPYAGQTDYPPSENANDEVPF